MFPEEYHENTRRVRKPQFWNKKLPVSSTILVGIRRLLSIIQDPYW